MDRLNLFASHVFVFRMPGVEDLNQELRTSLLAEEQVSPGLEVSNAGGWHSLPDLSQRPGPFQVLMGLFIDHVRLVLRQLCRERGLVAPELRFGVQSWAMIMRDADFTMLHDHARSAFSLVWYVDAGDAPDSGLLSLVDPRRGAIRIPGLPLDSQEVSIRPESGMLVLFPGYLQHCVLPYRGCRPRICISANVSVDVDP